MRESSALKSFAFERPSSACAFDLSDGRPLSDALFEMDADFYPPDKIATARSALGDIVRLYRESIPEDAAPLRVADTIRHVIFHRCRFGMEVNWQGDDFTLTATLNNRRASCLGLALLYVSIADLMGLPLFVVLYDGHVSIRYASREATLHIEPLYRGKVCPPSLVETFFSPPHPEGYGVPLSRSQLLAVVLSNRAAFLHAAREDFRATLDELEQAVTLFPTYISAWVNTAVVMARLGHAGAAREVLAYARALGPGRKVAEKIRSLEASFSGDEK